MSSVEEKLLPLCSSAQSNRRQRPTTHQPLHCCYRSAADYPAQTAVRSSDNNSLAKLSRLQYFQVGTLRTVAALRSLGHDACRPTTSTPKANPKILLPPRIHSTSPLPTFHPHLYLRYKSIRVDLVATEVKLLLIIFASATKHISRPSRWFGDMPSTKRWHKSTKNI